jgi:tetratricopeptide (TPR) repeat protein
VSCLGFDCALYRPGHEMCSFLGMPDIIDQVSLVGTRSTESLSEASSALARSTDQAEESLRTWQEHLRTIRAMLEETRQGLLAGAEQANEGIRAILQSREIAQSEQEGLVRAMDEVLHRLDREKRLADANAAAQEAAVKYRRGELAEALRLLDQALSATGGSPDLFNTMGCVYLRMNRPEDARHCFAIAVERDPGLAAAHLNLGAALLRLDDAPAAEEALRTGLRLDPSSGAGWNTLGNLLFHTGRRREAIRHWERAVLEDPGRAEAFENLRRQQQLDNCPFPGMLAEARASATPPEV